MSNESADFVALDAEEIEKKGPSSGVVGIALAILFILMCIAWCSGYNAGQASPVRIVGQGEGE